MTSIGFALIVALGSAIGAALVTPNEEQSAVILFVLLNAGFCALLFYIGEYAVRTYRDLHSKQR